MALKFDLSVIPSNQTVTNAQLTVVKTGYVTLYPEVGAAGSDYPALLTVHTIMKTNWDMQSVRNIDKAFTIDWSNPHAGLPSWYSVLQNIDTVPVGPGIVNVSGKTGPVTFTVTDAFRNGKRPEGGLAIAGFVDAYPVPGKSGLHMIIGSIRNTDISKRPTLQVTLSGGTMIIIPGGLNCGAVTVSGTKLMFQQPVRGASVSVFSMSGKTIAAGLVPNGTTILDLCSLSGFTQTGSGRYLVRITTQFLNKTVLCGK